MPAFSLRAIPAFVSIWPNRPHADWSETFAYLCRAIDAAWREAPFNLFIASCGSYGLPVCGYVRSRYGAPVLYVGNLAHFLFGVRQKFTCMTEDMNADMWIASDLGRYRNMDRIDSGSYT